MLQNKHFASDNYSGVHPEILDALVTVNTAHSRAYGNDPETDKFQKTVKKLFGEAALAFPVFNGTAANVIALQASLPRWGAVICAETAHINVDEAGAPERVGGLKLLPVATSDGKLTPDLIATKFLGLGDVHKAQPLAVSISQVTELGTCYTAKEIGEIADFAHANGMILHMDGSRLSNAAAHLNSSFAELTTDQGVDILSLGGTKNGAMGAEAIIVLNSKQGDSAEPHPIEYLRKMDLQLASKMRFISAQLNTLYGTDLWLRSASHANEMAALLAELLTEAGAEITRARESNAVFVKLEKTKANLAAESFVFYEWEKLDSTHGEYRLMCSFDTSEEEVRQLAKLLTV